MTKQVSFIIPHKGREDMLWQTVDSILEQTVEELDNQFTFDVHIVTKNEQLSVKSTDDQGRINIHHAPHSMTISGQRNFGASQSVASYLAFLDADVKLSSNWLVTMMTTLSEQSNRKLVAAMQIDSDNAPVLERIRTVLSNAELDCNVDFLPGRNLFLRRDTFEQVGGFPEHLITCEDYYFTDQVNQLGELYYTSKANYVHLGEDKILTNMYEKEIWRGQSNLQSMSGRSIPLRELPSFFVPVFLMCAFFIGPVLWLANYSALGLVILLGGLAIFIAYVTRLYNLAKKNIPLLDIIKFYAVYFPARAKGTVLGMWRTFGVKHHD